jgi:hypothetical protein
VPLDIDVGDARVLARAVEERWRQVEPDDCGPQTRRSD